MKIAIALFIFAAVARVAVARANEAGKSDPSVCEGILRNAHLSVSGGKILLLNPNDGHRVVSTQVGDARVMPAFELRTHSASVLLRLTF